MYSGLFVLAFLWIVNSIAEGILPFSGKYVYVFVGFSSMKLVLLMNLYNILPLLVWIGLSCLRYHRAFYVSSCILVASASSVGWVRFVAVCVLWVPLIFIFFWSSFLS